MADQILQTIAGQTFEVQQDAADSGHSYNTGGYSYVSNLGRVDAAIAQVHADSITAKVTGINSPNEVVVQLFSQGTGDAGEEGQEIDGDQVVPEDLNLTAYRL